MALGVEAIRAEFRRLTHERAAEDNECVDYVLDAEAGRCGWTIARLAATDCHVIGRE